LEGYQPVFGQALFDLSQFFVAPDEGRSLGRQVAAGNGCPAAQLRANDRGRCRGRAPSRGHTRAGL
jgi:hypothetical protein